MHFRRIFIASVLICAIGYSFGEGVCFDREREMIDRFGPSAPLYYWFPRCLPGGYFQNVQCQAFVGCYCSYLDTGRRISGAEEDSVFILYLRKTCPIVAEVPPDPCSMPPKDYPCKRKSTRYNYNPSSGKCERSENSCLGFETKEACSSSCVVTKRDKCSFEMAVGQDCYHRSQSTRWYHNENTGECEPFTFKGCGGNSNNYDSRWLCLQTCEYDETTELIIKVVNNKYYISLPTWLVEKKQFRNDSVVVLTVKEFKEIEEHLIKISKFETDPAEEDQYEEYRPRHAKKNISRDEICSMKKEQGPCRAFFPRWYFDKKQSKCIKFIYGGCLGNENRHTSASSCAIFCDAKVKPSEADLIEEMIFGLGVPGLGGIAPKPNKPKEENAGSRSLEVGPPKPKPVEVVGEEAELDFSFEDDEETTTEAASTDSPTTAA